MPTPENGWDWKMKCSLLGRSLFTGRVNFQVLFRGRVIYRVEYPRFLSISTF